MTVAVATGVPIAARKRQATPTFLDKILSGFARVVDAIGNARAKGAGTWLILGGIALVGLTLLGLAAIIF